nr:hypothetical protein [Tanacetum cinerariifolium]
MITDEMKLTDHYQLYTAICGVDVPTTQPKPIKSTQRTHRTTSTPRTPNPKVNEGETSVQCKSTVKEHLVTKETEQLVEGIENVNEDEFLDDILNSQEDSGTRIDPGSYKESLKAKIHNAPLSLDKEKLQELTVTDTVPSFSTPSSSSSPKIKSRHLTKNIMTRKSIDELSKMLYQALKEMLPFMRNKEVNKIAKSTVLVYVTKGLLLERQKAQGDVTTMIDDHHDDGNPEGENSKKRQKKSKYGTYSVGESLPSQAIETEPNPSTLCIQEQLNEWMDLAQMMMKFLLGKYHKNLWKKCEEHQSHIDQMQNYPNNDIDWESRKERLFLPTPQKPAPVYQSCQRDPKAPPMSLLNKDTFYLKHGNSGPKKYTLSLHKYHAVLFPDDEIEEKTSRWAKQFYIRMKQEQGNPIEEVYSMSKIIEVTRTSLELGHEHKFVTEVIVRRANGRIDPSQSQITKTSTRMILRICDVSL